MHMCRKCSGISAWLFLIFGILFLLRDFGIWNIWDISEWSVLFLILGLMFWGKGHCTECSRASSGGSMTPMKK